MKKDFVRFIPYAIVIFLLVASGFMIFERGGFDKEGNEQVAGAAATLPANSETPGSTDSPTPTLTPTGVPVRSPTVVPSINGVRGGEDD